MKIPNIHPSWTHALSGVLSTPRTESLFEKVSELYQGNIVYPNQSEIFRAFDLCPYDRVRVVLLGQDPYHGSDQANGLAFAVHSGIKIPPSLRNIFKEIQSDLGIIPIQDGDLSRWASQGVLLLNSTLTVSAGAPGSHSKIGWEEFTDAVIEKLSHDKEHLVFILWGNYARAKGARIDRSKHLVIESPHPSPFSARTGFFNSKPFSQTNTYLRYHGLKEIDFH
jgi:uracil-DNA glycosylase